MEMNYYLLTTQFKIIFKIFYLLIYFISTSLLANNLDNKINNVLSGYNFAEPSTRNMQDDDFLNPGILWVENGEKLWNKIEGPNKQSCNSCHGRSSNMKGISLKYPMVIKKNKKLINLEQRINICRKKMQVEKFDEESKEILSLSTLIGYKSRNMKLNYKVTENNKKWYSLGKELYFKKIGLMGLSCNQCHDERVGLNLRAEKVSQGQINGFPSYLLRWSKVVSVHKRIQFCNEQARAVPYEINSKENNALQLYLSVRGNGLNIETPAVRK